MIEGGLIEKGRASSFTEVSPRARRARIARRVGSERAAKVALRGSGPNLAIRLINLMANYIEPGDLSSAFFEAALQEVTFQSIQSFQVVSRTTGKPETDPRSVWGRRWTGWAWAVALTAQVAAYSGALAVLVGVRHVWKTPHELRELTEVLRASA